MARPPWSGSGNSQRLTALTTQLSTAAPERRALHDRCEHASRRGDGELGDDAPDERRPGDERLLVAVLHLVQMSADRAPDDLLVQGPLTCRSRNETRHDGVARVQAAHGGPEAVVGTTVAPDPSCRAERAAAADRSLVLATAAPSGSIRSEAAGAEGGAGIRGDQVSDDVLRIGAHGGALGQDLGECAGAWPVEDGQQAVVVNLRRDRARILRSRGPSDRHVVGRVVRRFDRRPGRMASRPPPSHFRPPLA